MNDLVRLLRVIESMQDKLTEEEKKAVCGLCESYVQTINRGRTLPPIEQGAELPINFSVVHVVDCMLMAYSLGVAVGKGATKLN